jgi:hypothetical protein
MSTPKAPPGLGKSGRRFWADTVGRYVLDDAERLTLREVCRTLDTIDACQAVVDEHGPVLPWGDGVRANPAAVEARQQRLVLARLLIALRVDEDAA